MKQNQKREKWSRECAGWIGNHLEESLHEFKLTRFAFEVLRKFEAFL